MKNMPDKKKREERIKGIRFVDHDAGEAIDTSLEKEIVLTEDHPVLLEWSATDGVWKVIEQEQENRPE
jgi:hypothetical protein